MERAAILASRSSRLNRQFVAVIALYVLLLAGGVWRLLGILENEMRLLAAPIIIALAIMICMTHFLNLRQAHAAREENGPALSLRRARLFLAWCVFVWACGFALELAGVHTGLLFGRYEYGTILQPVLLGVPLAIGCAWLTMIISSAALAQRFLPPQWRSSKPFFSSAVAAGMVVFDFFMEPAAVKLQYWNWQPAAVPLQNYAAWFAFGFMLAYSGAHLRFFEKQISPIAVHAYFAQLGYFILAMLS